MLACNKNASQAHLNQLAAVGEQLAVAVSADWHRGRRGIYRKQDKQACGRPLLVMNRALSTQSGGAARGSEGAGGKQRENHGGGGGS